jgi:hypothetical protein
MRFQPGQSGNVNGRPSRAEKEFEQLKKATAQEFAQIRTVLDGMQSHLLKIEALVRVLERGGNGDF